MTESNNSEMTFIEKFSNLINELKAPKGQKNTFGKYNYRSAIYFSSGHLQRKQMSSFISHNVPQALQGMNLSPVLSYFS